MLIRIITSFSKQDDQKPLIGKKNHAMKMPDWNEYSKVNNLDSFVGVSWWLVVSLFPKFWYIYK